MGETLKEHAYRIIKQKILNCEYQPNELLNEDRLCQDVSASRTPVRDAISRLEQENLLKILPKKGILVPGITLQGLNQIYETRILLEPYIILNYGNRAPTNELKLMYDDLLATDLGGASSTEAYTNDSGFHRYFYELCENAYFLQTYEMLSDQNYRVSVLSGRQTDQRLKDTQQEHLAVLNYLIEQDYARAAEAMRQHLRNAQRTSIQIVLNRSGLDKGIYL